MTTSQASLGPSPTVPKLLTIPRELRDEIYEWAFSDVLPSSTSPLAQLDRERVQYLASDTNTYYGEGANRYPKHTSLPPTHSLLQTSRQMRAEVLDSIRRITNGKVRYRIDLAQRTDKYKLYPTWISVPLFTNKVDVLEVNFRIREGKTGSMISVCGDQYDDDVDTFMAGLVLLRRFIERGVFFLSKKKARTVTLGQLLIKVSTPPNWRNEGEEVVERLEAWLCGEGNPYVEDEDWKGTDELIGFLGGKIGELRLDYNGKTMADWFLKDLMERRDRNMATIRKEGQENQPEAPPQAPTSS